MRVENRLGLDLYHIIFYAGLPSVQDTVGVSKDESTSRFLLSYNL